MRIDEKSKLKTTRRTEAQHLRAVPRRPEVDAPARAKGTAKPAPKDRFSDSGEREEKTSSRVSNILQGLQEPEGFLDTAGDLIDGVRDKAGKVVDKVRDTAGDVIDSLGEFLKGHRRDDSRLAEDREEDATVAVIDYFAEDGKDPEHGDIVESILMDNSGLTEEQIQRYRAGGGPSIDALAKAEPDQFGETLDSYIEGRVTGLLDASSGALSDILSDKDSSIRTVNQSLGVPESRIAGDIAQKMKDDPAFRERFLEYAGLDSNASQREVMQALVDEVGESRRSNETIQKSKERYDRLVATAHERGITTIDSSGNYGRFARELESLGVVTDDEFHTDVLNNPLVLSVGATDSRGTASHDDDTVSTFTSPQAGADISAPGTGVYTVIDGEKKGGNGTSYSAPQVAATAAVLAERYPDLTPAEIRDILQKTAVNPGLDSDLVGAGILQHDQALEMAEQLAA